MDHRRDRNPGDLLMTPEEITALLPILAPDFVGDPRIAGAIILAEEEVAPDHCFHDRVVILMAAHMLALADGGGTGSGQVTSKREGQLAITYGEGNSSDPLDLTSYGREAKRLTLLCAGGFVAMTKGFPYVP